MSTNELAATELNLRYWRTKAATMKLRGEDQTYTWEYGQCLKRMELLQRVLEKRKQRAALRLSSSTKPHP